MAKIAHLKHVEDKKQTEESHFLGNIKNCKTDPGEK